MMCSMRGDQEGPGTDDQEKVTELAAPVAAKKSRPIEALPTPRISFANQLGLLRAYVAASGPGGDPVTNDDVAGIVNMSAGTVTLANAFFADVGFLRRVDGGGGYIPANEVVAFARTYHWDPDRAPRELAPLVAGAWFAQVLVPRLKYQGLPEDRAVSALGQHANAGPQYRTQLRTLLDYLEITGVVGRDGELLVAIPDHAGPQDAGEPAPQEPAEDEAPAPSTSWQSVPQASSRGQVPLLLQGLIQELPSGPTWTRAKAEKWIDLAKLTFEVVYDFDPDDGRGGGEND